VIKDLDARVKTNGDIKVKGKGLILGGGNNVGRATGQSVFATLICDVTLVDARLRRRFSQHGAARSLRPTAISASMMSWSTYRPTLVSAPCSDPQRQRRHGPLPAFRTWAKTTTSTHVPISRA
jgi:hypothetical protein